MSTAPDVQLWFDPVCPFCWLTSRWLRVVAAERDLHVRWRFISLRIVNEDVDYDEHFPPDYEDGHTAGLRLLRVAARTREELGEAALDRLQLALGEAIWDVERLDRTALGRHDHTAAVLEAAALPTDLATALDEDRWDAVLRAETAEALDLTGADVGTPIIRIGDGPGFFGPVISRVPDPQRAVELYDHVAALASFPSFAELKRSLREPPQLRVLGADPGATGPGGPEQDWHQGRRPD